MVQSVVNAMKATLDTQIVKVINSDSKRKEQNNGFAIFGNFFANFINICRKTEVLT